MKLLLLVLAFVCSSLVQSKENVDASIPEFVSRRQSSDVYYYKNDSSLGTFCDNENYINVTYLVSERRCVTYEDLLTACSAAVIQAGPSTNLNLIADLATDSKTMSTVISLKEAFGITTKFKFNVTDQLVNSSFCQIASLEVYRGRKEAFQISHDGFSLSINGTVDINKDKLAYSTEELKGELYRMNLSCSGDRSRLPNSGCIFFKVLGKNSVATARFNCTVPGTLLNFTEECNITRTGNTITSTTSALAAATTTTISVAVPTNTSSGIKYRSTYLFVPVGCGASVVAMFLVCLFVYLFQRLHHGKTQSASLGEEKQMELQSQDSKAVNVCNTQVSPDCVAVMNERASETHTYALLEKPQPQQSTDNSPQLYEVPRRTIPKPKKQVNGGLDQQEISSVLLHQYDDPIKDRLYRSLSSEGNSNPSEHTYALPDTQKMTKSFNQYDEPLTEITCMPHSSEERADPSIHKYAVLEEPQS